MEPRIIKREIYLDHIISTINRGMMIFLVGQRRVGKSYMLLQMQEWLRANRPEANVLFIDKERMGEDELPTAKDLYEYVEPLLPLGAENYLLVDEVQDIRDYENALRRFYAENRCQIIATGSNANIFSSQLSTKLSGRYIEIPVYSLTYDEFLEFHKLEDNDKSLADFLKVGGLPGLNMFDINDERHLRDYIASVYNTVMLKDVIEREAIRNAPFMKNLANYIADNIGKPISSKNISNFLKAKNGKEAASEITTSTYLSHLTAALLVNPVYRYDVHGKELLERNSKYYFSDHGIRNYLSKFDIRGSIEKVMENVVWHHLKTQDFDVAIGQLRAGEIDFVATKDDRRIYVQVTYLLGSEETIRRGFGNLVAIRDDYPKYVVSMDPISGSLSEYPGIIHLRLRDFLRLKI